MTAIILINRIMYGIVDTDDDEKNIKVKNDKLSVLFDGTMVKIICLLLNLMLEKITTLRGVFYYDLKFYFYSWSFNQILLLDLTNWVILLSLDYIDWFTC